MRGQKIFNNIMKDGGLTSTSIRGRNNTLIAKRNDCLVARYYYYGRDKHRCFEDILRLLVGEFFLSPNTIVTIIQEHTDQILHLKEKHRSLYYFQSRWPHMKW